MTASATTRTTYLLDVNVLIALLDPVHVQHDTAHAWFAAQGQHAWATCPLTENGVLRIVGHARYPNTPGSPAAVAPLVAQLRQSPGHVFWPDDLSLLDRERVDADRLLSAGQVTDSYLLALACAHGGQLASFDRRLVTDAVHGGARALHLIG
jgi:toxin-antitoxin system PIN domain toxin